MERNFTHTQIHRKILALFVEPQKSLLHQYHSASQQVYDEFVDYIGVDNHCCNFYQSSISPKCLVKLGLFC